MAENKKKEEVQQGVAAQDPQMQEPAPRPNRDRYSAMFAEDNPDVDFEDKEARYGRMAEEREGYRRLKESGKKLSGILDKHRWLGAMLMDDEDHPFVWMAKHGIDPREILSDPEVMSKATEAFDKWKQAQTEGEAAEAAKDEALARSVEELNSLQAEMGLSDEQKNRMFEYFWDEVWLPAWRGEVSKDVWTAIMHAMNYDQDMANAREEAAMQARNEKHTNKLKTFDEKQVPPSFSQGQARSSVQKQGKKEGLMDFVKRYS